MSGREWTWDELVVGTEARFEKLIDDREVDEFVRLSGDRNPLHTDEQFARHAGFSGRVVHGAFFAALASRLIGMELPGRRSLLLNLKLDFVAPTFPGERVEVVGRVQSVHAEQRAVVLRVMISCGGQIRVRGSALVRVTS